MRNFARWIAAAAGAAAFVFYVSAAVCGAPITNPTATPTPNDQPVITIGPPHPSDYADVTIKFSGTPPKSVTAVATMAVGDRPMRSPHVTFKPTSDPDIFKGRVEFSISGSWTIHITYDGKTIDYPLVVGQ